MKKSKVLLTLACAVLLVAASVMGTLAYLTSTSEVKNTFSVGQVSIKLDEAKANLDGTVVEGATRVQANSYKLMPGHTYKKDPIIHVDSNSEDCYLFVTINNEIAAIEAGGDTTVAAQMMANGWTAVNGVANTNTYVYIGTAEGAVKPLAVSANDNITVFKTIKIAGSVDNSTLAGYADKTITVKAYAVQKDGFEDKTPADIWAETFGK